MAGSKPVNPISDQDLDFVLKETEKFWADLRGGRILITGGTGFFGHWLSESFLHINRKLQLNARLTLLTRNVGRFKSENPHIANDSSVDFIEGDVTSFPFPKERYSHMIHAATPASATLNQENPLLMLATIVDGTKHALEFAKASGVKRFLLTSSGAIYGKQPEALTHVSEDYLGAPDPCSPPSAYGEGKRIAEHLCVLYSKAYGIEAVIARCFAFVGPHLPLDGTYAIGNFIRDALERKPIQIKGDGTPKRSYLYAADLTIWLWTLLFEGHVCRPYNVGSEEALSIGQLAEKVAAQFGGKEAISVTIAKKPDPKQPLEQYVPSVKRAREELGLRAQVGLEEALNRTAAWLRDTTN